MNRTGLIVALAIAAVVGLLFGLYPRLDIDIAKLFFNASTNTYGVRQMLIPVRDAAMWLIAVLVAPAVVAVAFKLIWPSKRMLVPARAAVFLIATLVLGPGLAVNGILKDHWGRPRPVAVKALGGSQQFVAWWDPRGACPHNCSFVSGDVSGGFWTLAPAALVPPAWRPLAYAGAIAFGSGIAVLRMVFGGHFFTDTVFAGVLTFIIIWVVYHLLYCWRPTRVSDEAIELWLSRPRDWFAHHRISPR